MISYYLSKCFVIVEPKRHEFNNIPNEVKNRVHEIEKHHNDYILLCKIKITPYCNTMTNIYFHPNISHEFKS